MIDTKTLSKFLVKAKKSTYASGDLAKKIMCQDKSTSIEFREGNLFYHDNYFGGEPYGGREVVFFKNQPIYIMLYYGWVNKDVEDIQSVYKTLQEALSLIPENYPFRGPKVLNFNNHNYSNAFAGKVDNFSGEEKIRDKNGVEIYRAKYIGGLVDQRK